MEEKLMEIKDMIDDVPEQGDFIDNDIAVAQDNLLFTIYQAIEKLLDEIRLEVA